jgi:hypothetical protein
MFLGAGKIDDGFNPGVDELGCPNQTYRKKKGGPILWSERQPQAQGNSHGHSCQMNPGIALGSEDIPASRESVAKCGKPTFSSVGGLHSTFIHS